MGNVDVRNEIAYKVNGKDAIRVFIGDPWDELTTYERVKCVEFELDCLPDDKKNNKSWMWSLKHDGNANPPGMKTFCTNSPCVPPQAIPTTIAIAPDLLAIEETKGPVWYHPDSTDCKTLLKELADWCAKNKFPFVNLYKIADVGGTSRYMAIGLESDTAEAIRKHLKRFGGDPAGIGAGSVSNQEPAAQEPLPKAS